MGLFGRSRADQDLIDRQEAGIRQMQYLLQRACFRDPATGRMGKAGRVPARLDAEARKFAGL